MTAAIPSTAPAPRAGQGAHGAQRPRPGPWRPVVWITWALATAAPFAALALLAATGGSLGWVVLVAVPVLGYAAVGPLLCLRVPRNPIGWLFLFIGFALGLGAACDAYAAVDPLLAGGRRGRGDRWRWTTPHQWRCW